jgi:spore cortex formation protein SpoVR/YcgB (stage V sporulation)
MQCGGGFKVGFHFFCFNERACGVPTAEFTNQDQAGRESMFYIMTPFKTEQ